MKNAPKIHQLAPNQFWFINEGIIYFQSYETIICQISNYENGNEPIINLTKSHPQSNTTAKYLNHFLRLHTSLKSYKEII